MAALSGAQVRAPSFVGDAEQGDQECERLGSFVWWQVRDLANLTAMFRA
nr:hypothetical protein [Actinoallomurus bryophytorum]